MLAMTTACLAADVFATKAPRAVLMEFESGSILFQKNADQLAQPASMSKLMTLEVVFRAIRDGRLKHSDDVTMSVNAWRNGGAPSGTAAMMVPVNTTATVDELIKGVAVQSGNDAAMALAEHLAGSEAAFAKMMTAEARRIGLEKSTFGNATGLDHPQQLMTARELALLARHIIREYPDEYRVFSQRDFKYRKHRFINRNPLLFLGIGADGLKTGHTETAGYGVVGSAVQDGRRLIVVVKGLDSADDRKAEAARLLDWGFKAFGKTKIFDDGEVVGYARVWGGEQMYVPLAGKGDVLMELPRSPANPRLTGEIVYQAPLKPPVAKGAQVAKLRITSSTSATTEVPLYATEDVAAAGYARQGLDTLLLMALQRLAL